MLAEDRLIGTDLALEITIGSRADGTTPTFASAVNWIGYASRVRARESQADVDVTGFSPKKLERGGSTSSQITIDSFVPSSGLSFESTAADTRTIIGHYIRVRTAANKNLTRVQEWIGRCNEWEWENDGADDPQVERITINCNTEWELE